jgi:tetratricopeptide (TPR) repeat protein
LGNYKEAINCYRETLKINSKYALAMYNKGLAEDRLGTGRDAAASYQRFIEMAQVELNGHIEIARKRLRELKANNYSSTNYSDEATQGYSKTSYINQKDAETWNNKGVNLDNSGYYEEAIECYDRALKVNPQHALAWYNKGGCLISLKRYNQALECCNKALEINPQYAFAWYNKGIAEDQLALKKEAIISYRKFIEMAQTKHRKQVEYALKRLHELEASSPSNMKDSSVRAKESWEMPVQDEMRPKQPLILDADELLKKGDQCLEQGKCEQALKYFTDALKIKPDDLNLLAYRATALTRLSRNQEAITLIDYILDKHLATGLNLAYMYTGKANALVNLKRFEESLDYYQKALKIAGNVSTIWYMQGFAYYSMSKYELALKNFQKAYALSTDEKTREFIGWCYLGMENYIEALKIFEQLTINPPRDSLSWYGLGLAAKALGKIEQARDCIQRFLNQVKPEHADLIPQANKALKDLKK